jgi:hypothetical protein
MLDVNIWIFSKKKKVTCIYFSYETHQINYIPEIEDVQAEVAEVVDLEQLQ